MTQWKFSSERQGEISLPPANAFSQALNDLNPDTNSFYILERTSGDYIQCGGSKNGCTVEIRIYDLDGTYKHFTVGHRDGSNEPTTVKMSGGVVNLEAREVLTYGEAIELFERFFSGDDVPTTYVLRENHAIQSQALSVGNPDVRRLTWPETKQELMASTAELLIPLGYKLLKSAESYERKDKLEKRFIFFGFVASSAIHHMHMWCGIKNMAVEEIFHRTLGIKKAYRRNYAVVQLGMHPYVNLGGGRAAIPAAKAAIRTFLDSTALPFLERAYTMADYSRMLNTNPAEKCPYHATEYRYFYGLICAKLAADPCYEVVKGIYAHRLQQQHPDFPYWSKKFADLVADLESEDT